MKISSSELSDEKVIEEGKSRYLYLVVKSTDATFKFKKESVLLVQPSSGHVFIQTDKPIYSPRQTGQWTSRLTYETRPRLSKLYTGETQRDLIPLTLICSIQDEGKRLLSRMSCLFRDLALSVQLAYLKNVPQSLRPFIC